MSAAWPGVLTARVSDRLGSGIRSAPRDALIASSVNAKNRGKAFGLEGIGDNLGAFLGPLLTVLLFITLQLKIQYIFYLTIIPGLLSILMILLVKEKTDTQLVRSKVETHFRRFPKEYWRYLIVIGLFGIGNSSNSFLILKIKDEGLSLVGTVLIYGLFNLVAALISYPAGTLSDKYGRKPILLLGLIIFLVSYGVFAYVSNLFLTGILFLLYGLYQGIFRSVGKSFATDFVPENLRASSVGWYSTIVGLSGLFASIIAGQLWDNVGHSSVFVYGCVFAFGGIISLILFVPNKRQNIQHS